MKRFNAIEIVMLILTLCVSLTIVLGLVGMMIGGKTNAENEPLRAALISLLQYISGGIFGAIAVLTTNKKQQEP